MRTLTKDHKVPQRHGGPDTLDNLVSACRSCNCRKGVKSYAEFVHQIEAERRRASGDESPPAWLLQDNPLALEDELASLYGSVVTCRQ